MTNMRKVSSFFWNQAHIFPGLWLGDSLLDQHPLVFSSCSLRCHGYKGETESTRRRKRKKWDKKSVLYHIVQFPPVFRIDFIKKILGIFKRLFRAREDGSHVWIVTLIGVLCLMQFFSRGPDTVFFLFWKIQYGLTLAQYANMTIFLAVRTSIANWVLIPFLSNWVQDTTLIIVAQLTSIVGITVHALGTTFPAFYTSLVLFCFWSFGPTGTRCSSIVLTLPFLFKVDLVKADQPKRGGSCLLVDRNLGQICRSLLKTFLPLPLQSHGWILSWRIHVVPWRWILIGNSHHDQVTLAVPFTGCFF